MAAELHVRDAVRAGEEQGAVVAGARFSDEVGDDGRDLALEASGRPHSLRHQVARRAA
ncbi:hypothetical protein [Streptomyces sp. NPDC048508]|uniref:hypothetical protein n=1 Tax=Streptomyces sp. NPDC048508 TaxID=3365561 RepID=UPI0037102112